MHRAARFAAFLGLALASGASGASACSNFGSSNCTPPDSAYDRIYPQPDVYVPYGYEGPVVYGFTYGPRYLRYGPSYGPRYGYGPQYYGYGPPNLDVDD